VLIDVELCGKLLCWLQKNWDRSVCESNTSSFCASLGAGQVDEQCKQSQQVWSKSDCESINQSVNQTRQFLTRRNTAKPLQGRDKLLW